jgi:hypothetical protein
MRLALAISQLSEPSVQSHALDGMLHLTTCRPWNCMAGWLAPRRRRTARLEQQQDSGRPWAEAVAVLQKQYPEYDRLIRAYHLHWDDRGECPVRSRYYVHWTPPKGDLPDR